MTYNPDTIEVENNKAWVRLTQRAAPAYLRGQTVQVVPRHPRFGTRLAYPDAWLVGWRGERPVCRVRATMSRRV